MVMSKKKQKNCTGFSFSPKFRHVTIVLHVGPLKFVTRGDFFQPCQQILTKRFIPSNPQALFKSDVWLSSHTTFYFPIHKLT